VAINNHRLLAIDENSVRFQYRDYRDNRQKVMPLEGAEFLRRFCQHILPKGFVRIRHFGLLASSKRGQLRELQQAFGISAPIVKEKKNWKEICRDHLNYNPDLCPHCRRGIMITIEMLLPGRGPPGFFQLIPQAENENVSIQ
jgi:hypothetical protein